MSKHYLYNVTWRCQNACSYCWVRQTVLERPEQVTARERTAYEWIVATRRDPPHVIDIAGGEPFLYEGLAELVDGVCPLPVGISTNALATDAIREFCSSRFLNVVSINASYHPETKEPDYVSRYLTSIHMLRRRGYMVHANVVDTGSNVERSALVRNELEKMGVSMVVSPYEVMADLGALKDGGLCCKGGTNHLTIAPDGTAWPCLTTLRSPYWRETALGNWIDGTIDLSNRPQPCYFNCVDYYVLLQQHVAGDMWGIEATPCES